MKPAKIFRQYIWIINTLRAYRQLTFEELNKRWQQDGVADGCVLQRSSFNRHRDAILDMFGIIIDCDKKTYKYYIRNKNVLSDDSIEQWLLSTLAVNGVLADSASVKERLVLENAPAGEHYLDIIDNIDYIFHTHAKFYNVHEDLEETAVALPEVIEAYKKAGYTGFLSSEYEGGEHLRADLDVDSIEQVRRHQAAMKKYIGK